jgi:tetratricopeptide (TPR) repeat protein
MRAALIVCVLCTAGAVRAASPQKPDLLAQAEVLLEASSMAHENSERFRLADEAAALCERAARERPKDPEPILRLIRALTVSDLDHPEACRPGRCEQALAQLARIKQIDPQSLEAARVAAEEGILLSRMGRFAEAMVAYERALPLVEPARLPSRLDERPGSVMLWGNSAETAMALGRLDDAIRRYELALERSAYGEPEWQLSLWGLGVALDRDGQVDRASKTIQRVLERDPSLSRLHEDGVFFAPAGDLYYYEGLGHEVAGDRARAREAFEHFLRAQPGSRWAGRARAHLAGLARIPAGERLRGEAGVHVGQPLADHSRRRPDQVQKAIVAHAAELRVCYERLLRTRPEQTIEIRLAIEISPLGFVGSRARVLTQSEPALELGRCTELSAEGWRFQPLKEGDAEMWLIPIDFTPPRSSSGAVR